MDDCVCHTVRKVVLGFIIAIPLFFSVIPYLFSNIKTLVEKTKKNSFGVCALLYVAFWIYMVDFHSYDTKAFVIKNIIILAGFLTLRKIIYVSKYVLYFFILFFIIKFLKKMNFGKNVWSFVEKIKEKIKP